MTSLGRKKTESNCLANFPRTISQTSSLFRQSQHKRKIRDKNKSIVGKCSDLTCTKMYALTEGPKRGRGELMWATRSAPQAFYACYGLATIQHVLISKFVFRPEKLSGLSRRDPQARRHKRKPKKLFCQQILQTKRLQKGKTVHCSEYSKGLTSEQKPRIRSGRRQI